MADKEIVTNTKDLDELIEMLGGDTSVRAMANLTTVEQSFVFNYVKLGDGYKALGNALKDNQWKGISKADKEEFVEKLLSKKMVVDAIDVLRKQQSKLFQLEVQGNLTELQELYKGVLDKKYMIDKITSSIDRLEDRIDAAFIAGDDKTLAVLETSKAKYLKQLDDVHNNFGKELQRVYDMTSVSKEKVITKAGDIKIIMGNQTINNNDDPDKRPIDGLVKDKAKSGIIFDLDED